MTAPTITEFLLARITEDEEDQRRNEPDAIAGEIDWQPGAWHRADCEQNSYTAGDCDCDVPARVLAECEAKRRITEVYLSNTVSWQSEVAVRALAAVYADHPDYREEWRA